MGKFWSLVFLMVPVLGVLAFAFAAFDGPWLGGIWLPEDVSRDGKRIDDLFNFILALTGTVFVATEVALFWFLWRYDAKTNKDPVKFVHGSHKLEVIWTIIPAATLLFISIYQINVWADSKFYDRKPEMPFVLVDEADGEGQEGDRPRVECTAEVTGRQFEWRIRYPGKDGQLDTLDDIYDVNELHVAVGEDVLLLINSEDVLHSFFLPNLRIKQDVVPGFRQYLWFHATKIGKYDIVCAELCGWGHYKMKGRLIVETAAERDVFLENLYAKQEVYNEPKPQQNEGEDE